MDFTGKPRDVHFLAFPQDPSPEQASQIRCCRLRMAPVRFTQPLRNCASPNCGKIPFHEESPAATSLERITWGADSVGETLLQYAPHVLDQTDEQQGAKKGKSIPAFP